MIRDSLLTYLEQMLTVALETRRFVDGMTEQTFLSDLVMQRAVGMNLVMIGEATMRIMDQFPDFVVEHPELPWMAMRGMRNRLAHGYFSIDLSTVWQTVTIAIPTLISHLQSIRHWRAEGE